MDQRSDRELVEATAQGDEDALRELYERHAPWLLARVRRKCKDGEVARDVTQQTFIAVWEGASSYRGEGPVAAWMWSIAARKLYKVGRDAKRPLPGTLGGKLFDPSAEEIALYDVAYSDLGSALAKLPHDLRQAIELVVLDGLTTREVSRLLGLPIGTVKTRLMRARGQLRKALR